MRGGINPPSSLLHLRTIPPQHQPAQASIDTAAQLGLRKLEKPPSSQCWPRNQFVTRSGIRQGRLKQPLTCRFQSALRGQKGGDRLIKIVGGPPRTGKTRLMHFPCRVIRTNFSHFSTSTKSQSVAGKATLRHEISSEEVDLIYEQVDNYVEATRLSGTR